MTGDDVRQWIAGHLDVPAEQLVELDRRPLPLLATPGSFVVVTVRDRATGAVRDVAIEEQTGRLVDAAELRERDRSAIDQRSALSPRLRRLLLRHPGLDVVDVTVTRGDGTVTQEATGAAGVLALADDPRVVRVEPAGDTVIPD